jgi:hypothetical protein
MRETWADFAESTVDKQRGRCGRSVGEDSSNVQSSQIQGRKLFANCDDERGRRAREVSLCLGSKIASDAARINKMSARIWDGGLLSVERERKGRLRGIKKETCCPLYAFLESASKSLIGWLGWDQISWSPKGGAKIGNGSTSLVRIHVPCQDFLARAKPSHHHNCKLIGKFLSSQLLQMASSTATPGSNFPSLSHKDVTNVT